MDAAHIRVTREEIDEAYQKVAADFVEVMKKCGKYPCIPRKTAEKQLV